MFGLPTWAIRAIGVAIIIAAISAAGAKVMHQIDQGKADRLAVAAAQAQLIAQANAHVLEQKQIVAVQTSTGKEAVAQAKIEVQTRTIIQKVPIYVTPVQDRTGCVTFGLVRVLDAAVLGVDPATLVLPAGQSDDACTAVEPSALASWLQGDVIGPARANAEQLNALIADINARTALVNQDAPPAP